MAATLAVGLQRPVLHVSPSIGAKSPSVEARTAPSAFALAACDDLKPPRLLPPPSRGGGSTARALQAPPAAGAIVGDDLFDDGREGWRRDGLTLADRDGARRRVAMSAGDDPVRIGDDAAVVDEDVDVILGREERANVAVKHEVRELGALDGFDHLWVGGVDEVANLATDCFLPRGERDDIGVNARIVGITRVTLARTSESCSFLDGCRHGVSHLVLSPKWRQRRACLSLNQKTWVAR